MFYTGIGSRETPEHILYTFSNIATALHNLGYTLRSGGAPGADSAFDLGTNRRKIYLPWDSFSKHKQDGVVYIVPPFRPDLVEDFHPAPERLSIAGYKLMSRNAYQVLGDNLDSPSKFVVCWTSDGRASGGTGHALRIAKEYCIPIFNFFDNNAEDRLYSYLNI